MSQEIRCASRALPTLDLAVLEALAADLPTALMPTVVATFITETARRVADICNHAALGDARAAGAAAHALRGGAATFGAVALEHSALAVEQAGRVGDAAAVRAQLAALRVLADATMAALRSRYVGVAARE